MPSALAVHVDEPSYGRRAVRRIEYEIGEFEGFFGWGADMWLRSAGWLKGLPIQRTI